jgi:serine/threonine-protein kinase
MSRSERSVAPAVSAGSAGSAEDTTTGGGSPLLDAERLHAARRSEPAAPNGWFAGPHADPDRFELLGPGLAGGEGNTWRARYKGELTEPLTLAVKELRRPRQSGPDWPTPADLRRWDDQRALLQYMRIDHLVSVIDIFVGPPPHLPGAPARRSSDTPYVVMDWVPGPTLAEELSGSPATAATLDQRLAHVQHVAEALHALHSYTVSAGNPSLHRDVKPTNCILDPRRGVVLVDVGTMRRMDDGYDRDGRHTPAYTAPEVLADPQAARAVSSDLYALGALAYFCVLGEDPPTADQPDAAAQVESRLLAAARSAGVDDAAAFAGHLGLMLQAEPGARPSDPMAWARRLRGLGRRAGGPGLGVLRRPGVRIWAAAAVAVLVAVGIAVVSYAGRDQSGRVATPSPSSAGAGLGPPPGGGPPPDSGPVGPATPWNPAKAVHTSTAAIGTPANRAGVPQCALVEGTAKLPAGRTLLLAVENVSIGDGAKHLIAIDGWNDPSRLRHWRASLPIGRPEDQVGEKYLVEVYAAPLDGLRKQFGAGGPIRGLTVPEQATVAASVFVTRSTAPDSATCPPPP